MTQFPHINSNELLERAGQGAKILDLRPVDAYNGWRLQGEARGGHIPGACCLPRKWSTYIDWIEILRHKGLLPKDELLLYGYTSEDAEQVAAQFQKAGYPNVALYCGFLEEWVPDEKLPLQQLPRFRQLVPASWVQALISGEAPTEDAPAKYLVVHAHYRNREAYLSGHIPGAIDMDTNALESPLTWNRRSPEELKAALEAHGITADTTVVLYGKFMFPDNEDEFPGSAAGDIGAIRCAFIMLYAGVKDVRVLNGGFQSWEDAGYEIHTQEVAKRPVEDFGTQIPAHPEYAVDLPEAKELLAAPDAELVSVRSYREYLGEVSGYNYIKAKGRIPGSVFANGGSDAYHMENYRHVDHTTREYHEIEHLWRELGLSPEKRLAFYCGTGWRGSEAWFNAWLLGWPRVAVYDGGWFEWSQDPENPIETGPPSIK